MEPRRHNQEQLKNKFLGVEMSLEDKELGYKLTSSDIKKINTVKNDDFPLVARYASLAARAGRITLSFLQRGVSALTTKVLVPAFKEMKRTLVFSVNKMREAKERSEIALEGKLSKIETDLIIAKENTAIINKKRDDGLVGCEQELKQIFKGTSTLAKIECEKKEFEKINISLEFDISLYELMSKKLIDSNMMSNVSSITISTTVDEKNVKNIVEFELKVLGEKWAKIFSKFIAIEVTKRIDSYNGSVENLHVVNPLKKTETFIFSFTHHRLDIFLDNLHSKKISPDNHPQIDTY